MIYSFFCPNYVFKFVLFKIAVKLGGKMQTTNENKIEAK